MTLRIMHKKWNAMALQIVCPIALLLSTFAFEWANNIQLAVAVYCFINALILIAINYGTVPDVAVTFESQGGNAVRFGYHAYVVYAAAALALVAIAALCLFATILGAIAAPFALGGTALVAISVFSTLVSLAYVDRLVYEDFGVHVYEFDIIDVLRDGVARKHIGVRIEDLNKIYGLIVALAATQCVLFGVAYGIGLVMPGTFASIITLLLVAMIAGYAGFYGARRLIAKNNFEFFDALPLGSHLLLEGPSRPFIQVRAKRGASGYPDAATAPVIAAANKRKNIVVLMSDGLRADHVSAAAGLTPNIEKFVTRNRPYVAKRHFAGSHFTDQSIFSIFYGVDAFNFVPFMQERVPAYPLEVLKRNGYVSAFFTHSIPNKFPNNWLMDMFDESAYAVSDDEVIASVGDFLARRAEDRKPYIVFAFVYTPHWPYEFKDAFAVDRPHDRMPRAPHEAKTATKNSYRNSVRQADDYFRQVVELVQKDIDSGDTVFAFTSDHGTEFWEHDTIIGQGKATFWKEKVEVPLMIAAKGLDDFRGPSLSSHVSLMPTLLELVGVADGNSGAYSAGSLLGSDGTLADDPIIISGRLFPYANRSNAVVDDRSKYWLRTTGTQGADKLELSLFRAMTLDDAPLGDPSGQAPADLDSKLKAFQSRFFKYLEIVPRGR